MSMNAEDLKFFEEKLNEMPRDVLLKAVNHLQMIIPEDTKQTIRDSIDKHGIHEWIHVTWAHMGYGMYVRNELRSIGLTDDLLPDSNWDDYYVSVIEIVVGKRNLPLNK